MYGRVARALIYVARALIGLRAHDMKYEGA